MPVIDLKTKVPGPKSQEIMERRQKATVSGMALLTPVVIYKAKGASITDADGNTLLDFTAIETIKTISNPEFLKRTVAIGDKIRQHLEQLAAKYELIGDVRGLGPMLAAEIVEDRVKKTPAAEKVIALRQEALSRGLIILPSGLYFNCVGMTINLITEFY